MTSKLNPYIHFLNNTKDAMEFYKNVFSGELTMSTFKESGIIKDGPDADLIMHAMLVAPNGITLMASDKPSHITEFKEGTSISISLSGDLESELKGYWEKLSAGGNIIQPLVAAPWGDQFGMLTDKFGIKWMVNIAPKK